MRLGRPDDLPAAAAVLIGPLAMALATVVATDETNTPDGDLKVRYVFEPSQASAKPRRISESEGGEPAEPGVLAPWLIGS